MCVIRLSIATTQTYGAYVREPHVGFGALQCERTFHVRMKKKVVPKPVALNKTIETLSVAKPREHARNKGLANNRSSSSSNSKTVVVALP